MSAYDCAASVNSKDSINGHVPSVVPSCMARETFICLTDSHSGMITARCLHAMSLSPAEACHIEDIDQGGRLIVN